MALSLLAYRMTGAAFLDAGTYESIEHDRSATGLAAVPVVLSSVAAGIGVSGWYGPSLRTLALFTGGAVLIWMAWAVIIHQLGTRIFHAPETEADLGELLRTVGFSAAPGVLQAFGAFPRMTLPVFVASWIWMFLAMVVAVKHALDYQRFSRALAVCGLAAALIVAIVFGVGAFFGPALS